MNTIDFDSITLIPGIPSTLIGPATRTVAVLISTPVQTTPNPLSTDIPDYPPGVVTSSQLPNRSFLTVSSPTPAIPQGPSNSVISPITSSATTLSASTATTTSSSPTPKRSSRVSPGTVAGAVIGVVILLALLVAGIFLFLRRRKRKSIPQPESDLPVANTRETPYSTLEVSDHIPVSYARDASHQNQEVVNHKAGPNTHTAMKHTSSSPLHDIGVQALTDSSINHTTGNNPNSLHYDRTETIPHPPVTLQVDTDSPPKYQHNLAESSPHHIDPQLQYIETSGPHLPESYGDTPESRASAPGQVNSARLAELDVSRRNLEERLNRMRHISALEEEHASMLAEIERLKRGEQP